LQLTTVWVVVGGYLSTSLVLLAGLGLFSPGRRGLRIVLAVWTLLSFSRMDGQAPLLGHVVGWLPGMTRIAIAAAGARPLADQLGPAYTSRAYFELAVAWAVLIVVALAAIGAGWTGRARGAALCAVVAIDALALFAVPQLSAPRAVKLDLLPVAYLRRHLGEGRFFTLGPLQPNYGSYFGIGSANINDLPIPTPYSRYIHSRLDQYVNPTVFVGDLGGMRSPFFPTPAQELLRNLAGYRAAGASYVLAPAERPAIGDGVLSHPLHACPPGDRPARLERPDRRPRRGHPRGRRPVSVAGGPLGRPHHSLPVCAAPCRLGRARLLRRAPRLGAVGACRPAWRDAAPAPKRPVASVSATHPDCLWLSLIGATPEVDLK
jgi:hypothetical protein